MKQGRHARLGHPGSRPTRACQISRRRRQYSAKRFKPRVNGLDLNKIEPTADGGLRIGALLLHTDVAADMRVLRDYCVLARSLLAGTSGQLRNKAPTAGNLLQRTRGPYFYDTNQACNKRLPGSGCSAIGYTRGHAIVAQSEACIVTHRSDMAVAMRLLDAIIENVNAKGIRRTIPIAAF